MYRPAPGAPQLSSSPEVSGALSRPAAARWTDAGAGKLDASSGSATSLTDPRAVGRGAPPTVADASSPEGDAAAVRERARVERPVPDPQALTAIAAIAQRTATGRFRIERIHRR